MTQSSSFVYVYSGMYVIEWDNWGEASDYEEAMSLSSTVARRTQCHIHDISRKWNSKCTTKRSK